MMKVLSRIFFAIIFITLLLLTLHLLFNFGIDHYKTLIDEHGFWGSIKEFFVEIWTGFKATIK